MGSAVQQRVMVVAISILGTSAGFLGAARQAHAGQPLTKAVGEWLHGGAQTTAPSELHANAGSLDLSAPAALAATETTAVFPTAARTRMLESFRSLGPAQRAAVTEAADVAPSRAQALARNYQREGLPLAKLWQTKDALLHIGLNNKGKPGLWLVEKLH